MYVSFLSIKKMRKTILENHHKIIKLKNKIVVFLHCVGISFLINPAFVTHLEQYKKLYKSVLCRYQFDQLPFLSPASPSFTHGRLKFLVKIPPPRTKIMTKAPLQGKNSVIIYSFCMKFVEKSYHSTSTAINIDFAVFMFSIVQNVQYLLIFSILLVVLNVKL